MEAKKFRGIQTLFQNKHLNFYHMQALTDGGRDFDYYFASRNDEENIKAKTHERKAEGVVIYAVCSEDPSKIVLIRQYRYPIGDYLYELPAGLIDAGETAAEAAVREMREETGFKFQALADVDEIWEHPFYMAQGMSDEACQAVFGTVSGITEGNGSRDNWNSDDVTEGHQGTPSPEDTESITVKIADRAEVRRILQNEQVSLRMAYLMMGFLNADPDDPFAFVRKKEN